MFNIPIIKSNSCFPGAHCQSTLGPWDGRQYDKDDKDDDLLDDDDDNEHNDDDHQHNYIYDDNDDDDHYLYEYRRCKRLEPATAQQSRQDLNRSGFVNIMSQIDCSQAKKEKIHRK